MTSINIDTEAVQAIAQKAIIEGLGQEQRDLIMQQAVEALLARPEPAGYGRERGQSPLQQAFSRAINTVALEVAREVVAKDDRVRDRIREMMGEVVAELLGSEGYSETAELFADALTTAIRERLVARNGS